MLSGTGDVTRISVSLTDRTSGTLLWTDDGLHHGFANTKPPTKNFEAYLYVRQAIFNLRRGAYRNVIPLIEKSLAIDPEFAIAYNLKAVAKFIQAENGVVPLRAGYKRS